MKDSGDCISKEAFLEKERSLYCQDCSRRKNSKGKLVYEIGDAPCRSCGIGDVLDDVENFHAADVRLVVLGKWERMSDKDVFGDINCKCSACGEDWWQGPGWFRNARFCPNCGADMREES